MYVMINILDLKLASFNTVGDGDTGQKRCGNGFVSYQIAIPNGGVDLVCSGQTRPTNNGAFDARRHLKAYSDKIAPFFTHKPHCFPRALKQSVGDEGVFSIN